MVFGVPFYVDYVDGYAAGYGLCQNPGNTVGIGVRKATISIAMFIFLSHFLKLIKLNYSKNSSFPYRKLPFLVF